MCIDKLNTCGQPAFSPCVRYELELPEISKIEKSCVTIEDTTKDLYEISQEQKQELEDKVEALQTEIDTLKEQLENLQEENICLKHITECVNLQSIQDPCGEPITNLGQVLNYIINRI